MAKLFTTGQIAKYCGVEYHTVIRWVNQGALKAFQLPGRGDRRVKLDDFLAFLRANNMPIPEGLVPKSKRVLIVDDDPQAANLIDSELLKRIRVLVVSGMKQDDLNRALTCGADAILTKPFNKKELIERIAELIEG